jgi:hypothetical protein
MLLTNPRSCTGRHERVYITADGCKVCFGQHEATSRAAFEHSSRKIAERHYAPWKHSRQEQVEADLQRAWNRDPVVLLETKGAREVREENARPN